MINWLKLFVLILFIGSVAISVACSPSGAKPEAGNSTSGASAAQPSAPVPGNAAVGQPAQVPATSNAIDVVVAGYINHGPLQPTVTAIKDILSKYGDRVKVTWVVLYGYS